VHGRQAAAATRSRGKKGKDRAVLKLVEPARHITQMVRQQDGQTMHCTDAPTALPPHRAPAPLPAPAAAAGRLPNALLIGCVCFCLAPAPSTTAVDRCCSYFCCFLRGVFASLLLLLDPAASSLLAAVVAAAVCCWRVCCIAVRALRSVLGARRCSALRYLLARCIHVVLSLVLPRRPPPRPRARPRLPSPPLRLPLESAARRRLSTLSERHSIWTCSGAELHAECAMHARVRRRWSAHAARRLSRSCRRTGVLSRGGCSTMVIDARAVW
jgi:hypothetical protein